MPLPVERSQGSVQSLVARFQNAANRDAESTRRHSLPPSTRRTSSQGVRGGPSETVVKADIAPPKEEKLKDDPASASLRAQPATIPSNDGDEKPSAPTEEKAKTGLEDKVEKVLEAVKDLAVGGGTAAKEANEDMARDTTKREDAARITPGNTTSTSGSKGDFSGPKPASVPTPTSIPKSTNPSKSGLPSPNTSIKGPNRLPSVSSPTTSTTPRPRTTSGPVDRSAPSSSPQSSSMAKAATPSSTAPTSHRKEVSGTSTKSSSTSTPTVKKSETSRPTPRPSSSASKPQSAIRTPKLVPSMTGPVRRTPSTGHSNTDTTPLRPQLTGTPSKPTASSLAKTRTPSTTTPADNRRQTASLGRATGSISRARLNSASPSPVSGPSGTPKSPPSRSIPPSTSRLMQGTAASRAKAAESKASLAQKTTPNKSNPTAKPPSTKERPQPRNDTNGRASGDAPDQEPPVGPPPMRLGFAAAGLSKGGKTGKEYNEERNAKLRNGQTAFPKEGEPGGSQADGDAGPSETKGGASEKGDSSIHVETEPAAPTQQQATLNDKSGDISNDANTDMNNVQAANAGPLAGARPAETHEGIAATTEEEQSGLSKGSAITLPAGGDDNGHSRDISSGHLEEIPDIA